MLQPVPLFASSISPHGLLIFYEETPACGQAPYTIGLLPRNHPLCFGEKAGLCEGDEKEYDRHHPIKGSNSSPHFLPLQVNNI